MPAPVPRLHRRDHEHGGADPVRIVYESVGTAGTGGGIQFDTNNVGGWLSVEATGDSGAGRGMLLEADTGDILVSADTTRVQIEAGTDITLFAGRDLVVSADRDLAVNTDRDIDLVANGEILLHAGVVSGYLKIYDLPTSDPGVSTALWNDGGTLKISP